LAVKALTESGLNWLEESGGQFYLEFDAIELSASCIAQSNTGTADLYSRTDLEADCAAVSQTGDASLTLLLDLGADCVAVSESGTATLYLEIDLAADCSAQSITGTIPNLNVDIELTADCIAVSHTGTAIMALFPFPDMEDLVVFDATDLRKVEDATIYLGLENVTYKQEVGGVSDLLTLENATEALTITAL
jgi:hypothetical protein